MPIHYLRFVFVLLVLLYSSGLSAATLSIYSASVNPPDSPYSYLLSGNTIFDTVYATFNSTGVLAIGGILFAAGVIFALRVAPDPENLKNHLENARTRIRNRPLPFHSKEKPKDSPYEAPSPPSLPPELSFSASPIYKAPESFDTNQGRFDVDSNVKHVETDNFDFVNELIEPTTLGEQPGPPYHFKTAKRKTYFFVDYPTALTHSTLQVLEPVLNDELESPEVLKSKDDGNLLVGNRRMSLNYNFLGDEDYKTQSTYDNSKAFSLANPTVVSRYFIPLKQQKKFQPSRRQVGIHIPNRSRKKEIRRR